MYKSSETDLLPSPNPESVLNISPVQVDSTLTPKLPTTGSPDLNEDVCLVYDKGPWVTEESERGRFLYDVMFIALL